MKSLPLKYMYRNIPSELFIVTAASPWEYMERE